MTNPLFDDFDPVSIKEWKQKIQVDLKGADYNDTLIFHSLEGIDIKPFYHKEDTNTIETHTYDTQWKSALKIEAEEAISGNQKILDGIKKEAESIHLHIINENIDPRVLLKDIPTDIAIFVELYFLSENYTLSLNKIAKDNKLMLFTTADIIGNLGSTGNWYSSLNNDFDTLRKIVEKTTHSKSDIHIDLSLYQNAGATMIQQLAYGLAHANEYLNYFNTEEKNLLKESLLMFKVAIGSNYFFEIAKLRALRLLWSTLAETYGIQEKCHIIAYPSHRNKSYIDYNTNMLRTTTECMSAILGGADTVQNLPYDDIYNIDNEFGTRIALNQLHILKNESYFDQVSNPASGAYYIENITKQMAEKALSLFKNIEQGGGFLKQLKAGIIQKKIKESAKKEQELFNKQQIVMTGVNKYQNAQETIPEFQKTVFPSKKARKTLIEPIIKYRLSIATEKNTQ